MSDETFGERLRRLRDRIGLSQEELGSRVGLTGNHISRIERGEFKPKMDPLLALADVVGWDLIKPDLAPPPQVPPMGNSTIRDGPSVPREEFIERDYDYPRPYHAGDVPVNHQSQAGTPIDDGQIEEEATVLGTTYRDVSSGRYVVTKVKGDSMEPELHDRDLVLVDTFDKAIAPGRIFAVYIRGEGSTLAYVHVSAGIIVITKQNPKHPPRVVPDPDQIIIQGTVWKVLEKRLY